MLLENKVAVIHGGGGAIGGAVAKAFAHEGARVYVAGRALGRADAVAQAINKAGGLEVADAAVFVSSDRASSMTAATMNITGGMVVDW